MGASIHLQNFLFGLLGFASNIAMLILLIRFAAAPYLYAESGPFLQSLNQAAITMCRPFRKLAWWLGLQGRDYSAILAILAILIVRGLLYTLIPASFQTGVISGVTLIRGQQLSFRLGSLHALQLMGLLLFASVLFARAGGFYSGVFFRTVDAIAANVFQRVKKIVHVSNLWALFALSLIVLSAIYALLVCLIFLSVLFPYFWAEGILAVLSMLIMVMMLLTFAYIILSWFGPDVESRPWLILQAMVRPALERTRRLFPWARIGLIDLSPLFFFLGLGLCSAILASLRARLPV